MRDPSGRSRQELLATAFDEGIRHFDVARMYGLGAAESELGKFARGRRAEITIATKFGIEPASASGRLASIQGPARRLLARYPSVRTLVKRRSDSLHRSHSYDAETARVSLERSLRELQTDYVDILFVHDPSPGDTLALPEICAYLEEARRAGYLRAWGVAGEPDPCVQIRRSLPRPAILQTRDDIFRKSRQQSDSKPLVTFGALSGAIGRVSAHLSRSREIRERWSAATGVDCGSLETIASLLLCDALHAQRDAVILFSTTRVERLRGLDPLIKSTESDQADTQLAIFRELVGDELVP